MHQGRPSRLVLALEMTKVMVRIDVQECPAMSTRVQPWRPHTWSKPLRAEPGESPPLH